MEGKERDGGGKVGRKERRREGWHDRKRGRDEGRGRWEGQRIIDLA